MKENTPEMFSHMRKFEMHRQRNVNDMQRPALLKDDVRLIATLRPQIKMSPNDGDIQQGGKTASYKVIVTLCKDKA